MTNIDENPTRVIAANVLIVEDDRDTAEVYVEALKRAGYGTRQVPNRHEALRMLGHNLYHVIIMDVMMPGATLELFMSYRDSLFPAAKVIFISAYPQLEERARNFGVQHVLKKPFDSRTLRNSVAEVLAAP